MNRGSEGISPFTVSQWQELEHQALIYKYLIAGVSVPADLVLPIQNSYGTSSSSFFHRPTLGYCGRENSLYGIGIGIGYGKKIDPEPGRCRRTDGKKWRCAKEAYPDSKYCERHMNRGRSRSRKHVESHPLTTSSSPSLSTATTSVSALTQSLPLKYNTFASASSTAAPSANPNQSQFQLDSIPYAIPTKPYSRYLQGSKPEAGEHLSFSQCSDGNRSLLMDSALDNTWSSSQMSSFSQSKPMNSSSLHDDYSHHSLINCEFGQTQPVKQGSRSLHPFFEEWPNNRDWSGLEDESANQVSFSTAQLSISVPMASDFSTSPQSPQES